jgi:hypothetical protein
MHSYLIESCWLKSYLAEIRFDTPQHRDSRWFINLSVGITSIWVMKGRNHYIFLIIEVDTNRCVGHPRCIIDGWTINHSYRECCVACQIIIIKCDRDGLHSDIRKGGWREFELKVQRIYLDPRVYLRIVVEAKWMPRLVTVGWQRKEECIIHKQLLVSWGCWKKSGCCINDIKRCPRLRSDTIGTTKCAGERALPEE